MEPEQDLTARLAKLRETALAMTAMSYAPYSKYRVGAALISKRGHTFTGCNVENASYGLTSCAERNAIFQGVAAEGPSFRIELLVCLENSETHCPPCGACRQVIREFSTRETKIQYVGQTGWVVVGPDDLLPDSFHFGH